MRSVVYEKPSDSYRHGRVREMYGSKANRNTFFFLAPRLPQDIPLTDVEDLPSAGRSI